MTAMKEVNPVAMNAHAFLLGYSQKQAARELMQGAAGMLAVPTVMGGILGAMVARKKHRISGAVHGALMGAGTGVGAGAGVLGGAVGGAGLGTLIGGGAGGLMNLATETDAQSKRSEVDKLRKPYAVEREAAKGLVGGAAAGAVTGTLAGAGLGGVAGGAGGFVLARKLSRMIRERNSDPFAKNPVEETQKQAEAKMSPEEIKQILLNAAREEAIDEGSQLSTGENIAGITGGVLGAAGGAIGGHELGDKYLDSPGAGMALGSLGGGALGSTLALALMRTINRRKTKLVAPNTLVGIF